MTCPGNGFRHWFRAYGVVGLVAPECVRCGAPNPKITQAQRAEWAENLPYLIEIGRWGEGSLSELREAEEAIS